MKQVNDPLSKELVAKHDELEVQRKEMLKRGVEITLAEILSGIVSHKDEITQLMIGKIQKGKLQNLASSIIFHGCNGNVRVPHFSPSADKTSPVWVYVGTHWDEIPHEQMFFDFIRDACRNMELGEEFVDDEPFFKKLKKQLELKLSRHTQQIEYDNMVLVNFINGTLEIKRNGERNFRPHRREDYFRYVLPYPYDPQAECPRFQQFFHEVLPNISAQTTILEYTAYCLVPWLKLEKILGLLGTGANGKSVLLGTIKRLFGKANVAYESLSDLTNNETHRANIEGRLVNISTENEGRINSAVFKVLASGEPCSCRLYYSQPYTMTRYAKLLFAFNDMPRINSGYGSMRRWLLVKFDVRINEDDANTELEDELALELPGILNLVLSVLPALLERKKFSKSEAVAEAVKELEIRNNTVLQFVTDRCETNVPTVSKGSELYKSFCEYCEQNGFHRISNQEFYRRLEEKYEPEDWHHQKAFHINVVRYED